MNLNYSVHLPGVSLEGFDQVSFAQGRLVCLPFDDWYQLDNTFYWAAKDYEKSRPVFYVWQSELPDDQLIDDKFIHTHVSEWLPQIHHAFLLAPNAPLLPNPQMSVNYATFEFLTGVESVVRLIGPLEREWIVYGPRIRYDFDENSISVIRRIYDFLSGFDLTRAFSGIEGGIHTLSLTAHPEFFWDGSLTSRINEFIHCVAAAEFILLPPEGCPPGMNTRTFGQHAAVLASETREELQDRARVYSNLYTLRSQLIHGKKGIADVTDEEASLIQYGRYLLRGTILNAMALSIETHKNATLPALLAQAYEDSDAYLCILHGITDGWSKK